MSPEWAYFNFFRQNAFQVVAVDGVCSGVIQCPGTDECTDWLQAIATNISALTKHNVSTPQFQHDKSVESQFLYKKWLLRL